MSLTCQGCGKKYEGNASHPLAFLAAATHDGWQAREAHHNKPILCPACKAKQT